jgi:hypothetical protein
MYIYIYMYTYTYMYIYIHIYYEILYLLMLGMYMFKYIYIHEYVNCTGVVGVYFRCYVNTYIYIHIHIYVYTYIWHICLYTFFYMCIYMFIYIYTYTCIYMYVFTNNRCCGGVFSMFSDSVTGSIEGTLRGNIGRTLVSHNNNTNRLETCRLSTFHIYTLVIVRKVLVTFLSILVGYFLAYLHIIYAIYIFYLWIHLCL